MSKLLSKSSRHRTKSWEVWTCQYQKKTEYLKSECGVMLRERKKSIFLKYSSLFSIYNGLSELLKVINVKLNSHITWNCKLIVEILFSPLYILGGNFVFNKSTLICKSIYLGSFSFWRDPCCQCAGWELVKKGNRVGKAEMLKYKK